MLYFGLQQRISRIQPSSADSSQKAPNEASSSGVFYLDQKKIALAYAPGPQVGLYKVQKGIESSLSLDVCGFM